METYMLMDLYGIKEYDILNLKESYLNQIKRISIGNMLYEKWKDQI